VTRNQVFITWQSIPNSTYSMVKIIAPSSRLAIWYVQFIAVSSSWRTVKMSSVLTSARPRPLARGAYRENSPHPDKDHPPWCLAPSGRGGIEGFGDETRRITSLYSCRYLPARRFRGACPAGVGRGMRWKSARNPFVADVVLRGDTRRDRDETAICQLCDKAGAVNPRVMGACVARECDVSGTSFDAGCCSFEYLYSPGNPVPTKKKKYRQKS